MKIGNNMKVVIVGCGFIGRKRANSIGSSATLVACCDIDNSRAYDFSNKYGNIPYFDNINNLIKKVEFDIIILATTHNSLPNLIKIGIENSKHVLVEKPAARFFSELEGLRKFVV